MKLCKAITKLKIRLASIKLLLNNLLIHILFLLVFITILIVVGAVSQINSSTKMYNSDTELEVYDHNQKDYNIHAKTIDVSGNVDGHNIESGDNLEINENKTKQGSKKIPNIPDNFTSIRTNDLPDVFENRSSINMINGTSNMKHFNGDMTKFGNQTTTNAVKFDERNDLIEQIEDNAIEKPLDAIKNPKGESPPKPQMNMLFIVSDDLRPQIEIYKGQDHPNPFSSSTMQTPNLDALARRSLLLTRAYNQFSVCGPSRASYMTSRRPDTIAVYDLVTYWRNNGNFTTIPQYFRQNGYITAGLGKIYHPGKSTPHKDPLSWTEKYYTPKYQGYYNHHEPKSWESVNRTVREDKPLPDEDITNEAINKLRQYAPEARAGKQPFFLAVGYLKPHLPLVCPEEAFDLYPLGETDLPGNMFFPAQFPEIAYFPPETGGHPDMIKYNCSSKTIGMCIPPPEAVRLVRRAYFSCVSYIDSLVGRLIREVEELGLADSTVISFVGDHGYHLGENGMIGKHTNMEAASHSPLMIHIPGSTDHGIVSRSLVELLDLFPTLVEACGLAPIPQCPPNSSHIELCTQGQSLIPLIMNPEQNLRQAALSQILRQRSMGYTIRTNNHRYMEWVYFNSTIVSRGREHVRDFWKYLVASELYDHDSDPEENDNRDMNPAYRGIKDKLSTLLHQAAPLDSVILNIMNIMKWYIHE